MFGLEPIYILIIFAIAIIFIVVIIANIVASIKRAKRRFESSLTGQIIKTVAGPIKRGEVDMGQIMKQAVNENMEDEPKSVSAMTSLMLPRITRDFPNFNYNEIRERARIAFLSYLRAINQNNVEELEYASDEIKRSTGDIISQAKIYEKYNHYDSIKVHQLEISNYSKVPGKCIIVFQMSVEYYNYITNLSGEVLEGSKDKKVQTRYNVELIYVQDRDKIVDEDSHTTGVAVNCPNCGAPLKSLGSKKCAYCGTPVAEINVKAWMFSSIYEYKR